MKLSNEMRLVLNALGTDQLYLSEIDTQLLNQRKTFGQERILKILKKLKSMEMVERGDLVSMKHVGSWRACDESI